MIEYTSWDDPVIGFRVEPFNWRLRRAREARGWSRAALAREVGISPGIVGDAEKLRHVSANVRERIAFALSIPEDVLFPGVVDDLPKDGPGEIEIPFTEEQVEHWKAHGSLGAGDDLDALTDQIGHQEALERAFAQAQLSPRESAVIQARFGLGTGVRQTYDEIAEPQGVTRERVRQIESKALRKLRRPISGLHDVWLPPESARPRQSETSPFVAFLRERATCGASQQADAEDHLAGFFLRKPCCRARESVTSLRAHLQDDHEPDQTFWDLFERLASMYRDTVRQHRPQAVLA